MSATAPVLRTITIADADSVGRVHLASWVETYTGLASADFWEQVSAERSAANWRRWLENGLDATLAEVDGEVVGLAAAGTSYESGGQQPVRDRQLFNLYVLAARHGSGVGQSLLDAVLPPGVPAQLWVAAGNPRAVRFYERNGFTADGATDDGSTFGGIAALRMLR